jgi:hypothetical protein
VARLCVGGDRSVLTTRRVFDIHAFILFTASDDFDTQFLELHVLLAERQAVIFVGYGRLLLGVRGVSLDGLVMMMKSVCVSVRMRVRVRVVDLSRSRGRHARDPVRVSVCLTDVGCDGGPGRVMVGLGVVRLRVVRFGVVV